MSSRKFKADTLKSVSFGSITTSYANLGSALSQNWVQMVIKNTTDQTLLISENGTDDHYEIPSGTTEYYDFQTNAPDDKVSGKGIATQFQVKANAGELPTSGKIILQGQYL